MVPDKREHLIRVVMAVHQTAKRVPETGVAMVQPNPDQSGQTEVTQDLHR